jgi:hypothetical protein
MQLNLPILDTGAWLHHLQFCRNLSNTSLCHLVQIHQWCIPNQLSTNIQMKLEYKLYWHVINIKLATPVTKNKENNKKKKEERYYLSDILGDANA